MMTVFDPISDLARLRRQIDRVFLDAPGSESAEAAPAARHWRPPADLHEDEEKLEVVLDLPGVEESSIDVQLTGDELVIHGERPWIRREKGGPVHTERPFGQFHRVFRVGVPVQSEGVSAEFAHGVLTVTLPKADVVKPRRVPIVGG